MAVHHVVQPRGGDVDWERVALGKGDVLVSFAALVLRHSFVWGYSEPVVKEQDYDGQSLREELCDGPNELIL
eukprot:3339082-Rhodomonas_salina.1